MTSKFDNTTTYQDEIKRVYGCDGWKGEGQQYHISTVCYYLASVAQPVCDPEEPAPKYCKSSCDQWITSQKALVANEKWCSKGAAEGNRTSIDKSKFAEFCGGLEDGEGCVKGLAFEVDQCGK